MSKPIYILGTSLSHNGSVCLLKDGKICAAIEKERITRKKQDGYNDSVAIRYCLEKEGVAFEDISLIVQNSPISFFENGNQYFSGPRLIKDNSPIPVVTISHHLAHAYSAFGPASFDECAVLVIDGSGNALEHCIDVVSDEVLLNDTAFKGIPNILRESNSYYHFNGSDCTPVCKEFSLLCPFPDDSTISPYTDNSIGDLFAAASRYCFRDMHDAGKLMGLAPYGDATAYREPIFHFKDGRVFIDHSVLSKFKQPSRSYKEFKQRFQYYANIANWVQREAERAVLYVINSRYEMRPSDNLAYAGGVALNAVINNKILEKTPFKNLFIQPAAGDNGICVGCAFYGWLEVLKRERKYHGSSTCFGKIYSTGLVKESLMKYHALPDVVAVKKTIDSFFVGMAKTYSRQELNRDNILIQFNIKNSGIYQVKVTEEGIECQNDILGKPTSEVSIQNNDLYQGLLHPHYFNTLMGMNRIDITNYEELSYLMKLINLEKSVSSIVYDKNDAFNPDYIHYEGEGYIQEAARLLTDGKIIGWFQDESEFGPRALGRRSILADPRKRGVRDFINGKIKLREDFRPFAPSVLLEDVSVYFEASGEAPHMLTVSKVKEEWWHKIPDVVHEDGTCRIQTVTNEWNPKYYSLLQEFKKDAGIGILLNTSFNGKAMPIVETPDDAISFFYNNKLDFLVIQDIILKRPEA